MRIKYDAKAEAVYIYLTDIPSSFGVVDHTQELTEDVLVDWTKDGTLYGIEVVGVKVKPLISVNDEED